MKRAMVLASILFLGAAGCIARVSSAAVPVYAVATNSSVSAVTLPEPPDGYSFNLHGASCSATFHNPLPNEWRTAVIWVNTPWGMYSETWNIGPEETRTVSVSAPSSDVEYSGQEVKGAAYTMYEDDLIVTGKTVSCFTLGITKPAN